MLSLLLLVVGFVPLVYGANLLVDSASSLAKRFNIPNIVIGLTIVAIGTSAPELIVNIIASLSQNSDITLGNIVGSNIFNVLGILGISAIIFPLTVKSNTTWLEIPLCFLSAIVIIVISNDMILTGTPFSLIDRIDGIILLLFFVIFLVYNIQVMRSGEFDEEMIVKDYSVFKSILFIVFGFSLLVVGGKFIVSNAMDFAQFVGIPERIIALTIVSIGTSLPELATSVIAAKKGNVDIAIGNIVGSNIFNVFFILGISAIIHPVTLQQGSNVDMTINIISSILLFAFIFISKERKLDRWVGILFVIFYLTYLIYLVTM